MSNSHDLISIGFGNKGGKTTQIVLQEKVNIVSLGNVAKDVKKIELHMKNYENIAPERISDIIRRKRDRKTLVQLLKVDIDCDFDTIKQSCEIIDAKIANDFAILGVMMEENKHNNFVKETGSTQQQASQYLNKYPSEGEAIKVYKSRQEKIAKFMKQNNCNRQNAKNFLQSCGYNDDFLN